jgi:hypothetical protein
MDVVTRPDEVIAQGARRKILRRPLPELILAQSRGSL